MLVLNGDTGASMIQDGTVTSAKIVDGQVAYADMVGTDIPMLGVGQTWQNVTASRAAGVTYTNTTGKPIFVSLETAESRDGVTSAAEIQVNGVVVALSVAYRGGATTIGIARATTIVPNGSTYRYSWESGIDIVQRIFELR